MQRLVGASGALAEVERLARRVAGSAVTVLVTGETGVGKEVVARFIHANSPRAGGPFVAVNCAALTDGIIESELFGHERGAFTNAFQRREGRFEAAQGGTIFLDEIGDVSPRAQLGLLRVLQERRCERVGGTQPIELDVRVVAATHRCLTAMVRAGTFREDLYYRLNVFGIEVPPLRARACDIMPLAERFLAKWGHLAAVPGPKRIGTGARELLETHVWPGNVRELENAIQRALILADGPEITPDLLRFEPAAPPNAATVRQDLRRAEVEQLRQVLIAHGGNLARAARTLGVPRTTLMSRAKRLGLA